MTEICITKFFPFIVSDEKATTKTRKEEFVRKRDDYFPPLTFGMDPDVVLLFRIFPFTTFEIFKWRARTYFPSTFFGMDPKFSFLFSFGLAPTPTLTGPDTDTYILQDFGMAPKIEERGQVLRGRDKPRSMGQVNMFCGDQYKFWLYNFDCTFPSGL